MATFRISSTKAIRICKNYPEYRQYFATASEEDVPTIKNLEGYIEELKGDLSHVTLKLRQALNFFRNDPLRADDNEIRVNQRRVTISAELFAQRREEIVKQYPLQDPMEFTPSAPFTPRIILKGGRVFSKLSSGEQQYIHTIQAAIYHILNLNSVFKTKQHHSKATYPYLNLILDEIELYFHPEFQRRFLNDLLKVISGLNIPHISGINILLLTHSPFILSDIPAQHVARMKEGNLDDLFTPTFAGNIHQMLMTSFFMTSTTGDFARHQYESIIKLHQQAKSQKDSKELRKSYLKSREKFRFIVSLIAEDVVRGVLENHLDYLDKNLIGADLWAENRRRELEEQLAVINKELEDLQ